MKVIISIGREEDSRAIGGSFGTDDELEMWLRKESTIMSILRLARELGITQK